MPPSNGINLHLYVEERMLQLQDKKRLVFEGCMDGNQASLAQLTEEDLQFLFKR